MTLVICSMPVRAEEKVWYCETTGYTSTNAKEGVTQYKTENFKFKVTAESVVFGTGGFFSDTEKPIVWWASTNAWQARDEYSTTLFFGRDFNYALDLDRDSAA